MPYTVRLVSLLDGKSVMITGGTGSFGRAFVKAALEQTGDDLGDYYVIEPNLDWWVRQSHGTPVAPDFHYTSDTNDQWLNGEQLQDIVRNV